MIIIIVTHDMDMILSLPCLYMSMSSCPVWLNEWMKKLSVLWLIFPMLLVLELVPGIKK